MQLSWFKKEEGSTSLTVVLGIMLSLVLLASSVQWYWTNSSSSDIQTVADIGVLAAADVSAKSVMVIQALDAMLLSANLFGLVLHAVTVIAGLLAAFGGPVIGPAAATFAQRATQFNQNFVKKRKRFAQDAYRLAARVNDATPYLAAVQAHRVARENSGTLKGFNNSDYYALAIPFPVKGQVELTGFPENEQQLAREVTMAGEENSKSAKIIKELEDEIEAAIDECYRLDVFLPSGTSRAHWDPLTAFDDFIRGWSELSNQSAPTKTTLSSLSGSAAHDSSLQQSYREDYRDITGSLDSQLKSSLNASKASKGANVSDIHARPLLNAQRQQRIYLVIHEQGERKAYHQKADCFGLSNAGELQSYTLAYVMGDFDHPPCLLCKPMHWQAVEAWEQQLVEYAQSWNREAAALRRWYAAEQKIKEEEELVQERTESIFETLIEEAKGFIVGGRLSYTPAGARGYVCIVINSAERELPAFTLPALTGSDEVKLGRQIAIAGARLMPSESESTIPSLLNESHESASAGSATGGGFSELTQVLVSDDGSGGEGEASVSGTLGAVGRFALGIWGSCLALYTKGADDLERFALGLPFGLDSLMVQALDFFFDTAQMAAPDLRRPVPVLVNTADIGDVNAGGFEAGYVKSITAAKDVMELSGGLSAQDFRESLSAMLDELNDDVGRHIDEMMKVQILGVSIPLPFSQTLKDMASTGFAVIRSKKDEIFAALSV